MADTEQQQESVDTVMAEPNTDSPNNDIEQDLCRELDRVTLNTSSGVSSQQGEEDWTNSDEELEKDLTQLPESPREQNPHLQKTNAKTQENRPQAKAPYQMRNKLNFDEMIEVCRTCKYLPEPDMRRLCDYVMDILMEEPNVQSIASPVTVCGDLHGQFYDLLELFRTSGELPKTNYVFLGDFVDRGHYSLETLTYLLCLKARYPDKILLLRGNHETRQITQVYGFYDECYTKYGNLNVYRLCARVFDLLSVAALIDNTILCVHGGLSPEVRTLDQIRTIDRQQEVPHQGAFCDLVWSDPDDVDSWQTSPRGAGYLFGQRQVEEFMELNGLDLIARAHQLILEGLRYQFNDKLVTVWSAPNYCYRCGNVAAVLDITPDGNKNAKLFQAVPDSQRVIPPKNPTPYFL